MISTVLFQNPSPYNSPHLAQFEFVVVVVVVEINIKILYGMHSPLVPHLHQQCEQFITALQKCHEEHKWGKLMGKCNQAKEELNKCFRKDSQQRRKNNNQLVQERNERTKEAKRKFQRGEE